MCKGNFSLYVVVHFIPFNMICNMTFFRKKMFWPFDLGAEGQCKGKTFICMLFCLSLPFHNIIIF